MLLLLKWPKMTHFVFLPHLLCTPTPPLKAYALDASLPGIPPLDSSMVNCLTSFKSLFKCDFSVTTYPDHSLCLTCQVSLYPLLLLSIILVYLNIFCHNICQLLKYQILYLFRLLFIYSF